eukprot:6203351-Pleurochrysis_carterae.AAC.1
MHYVKQQALTTHSLTQRRRVIQMTCPSGNSRRRREDCNAREELRYVTRAGPPQSAAGMFTSSI